MGHPRLTPRKAPRQGRSKSTVDAILTATARVLVADGFDETTTNRIAEVAGVSIGSLYQYFPTKESLLIALLQSLRKEMLEVLTEHLAAKAAAPLAEVSQAFAEAVIASHRVNPPLLRILLEEAPKIGALRKLEAANMQIVQVVQGFLEARRKDLRPKTPALAAFVLVKAVDAVVHAVIQERPGNLEDGSIVDELRALIEGYLTRRQSAEEVRLS